MTHTTQMAVRPSTSNTWSSLIVISSVYGQYAATAFDALRNRLLIIGTGNALVYDPLLDVFLYRTPDAGGAVYRINPQTFSVDTLTTTGGTQLLASTNGVWTRFLYAPQLKGIVYVPTYSDGIWFLRTY